MFCEKCGAELKENEKTCPGCGAQSEGSHDNSEPVEKETVVTAEEIRENIAVNEIKPEEPKRKKSPAKLILVFGIAAAVILVIGAAIFAMKSDMFKSPKSLFLEIEGDHAMNSINKLADSAESNYEKLVSGNPEENKIELSGNVDLGSLGDNSSMVSTVSELLKNLKITVDSKSNPKENQGQYDIGLSLKGNKLLNGKIISNKGKYALSVPDLYSKYLVFSMSDLGNLTSGLGVSGANSMKPINGKELLKAIHFDKDDYIKLLKSYGKTLGDSIDEKQVTLDKGINFKVNDLTIKCDKLTVSMDQKSFEKLVYNLLDKAKDDEMLYSLTAENVLRVMKLYSQSGYPMGNMEQIESKLTMKNFKKGLSDFKKEMEKSSKTISMPDGIKMTLYADGHTIVGRTIEAKVKSKTSNETVSISLNYNGVSKYKNRNIFNLELKASSKGSSDSLDALGIEEINAKVHYDTKIDNDIEKGKLNITLGGKGSNFSANVFNADIGVKIDRSNGPDSTKYAYDYNITAGIPMKEEYGIKGNLDINSWNKDKGKKNGKDVKLSIEVQSKQSPDQKFGGSFNIKTEKTKDIELKMPDINDSNSLDLSKASPEDLNQLYNEVVNSLQKLVLNNPDIMKMFSGVLGSY